MHLLAAQSGIVSDGAEPIDPGQTPADIVFLSAADTELAALAAANARLSFGPDFLRLAQLSWLAHPFATDLYIDNTASRSRLVVVRALGGLSYWNYCLEQFASRLPGSGAELAVLPGDDKPDEELFGLSTVTRGDWEQLLGYCVEGGPDNAAGFLALCRHILEGEHRPPPPRPLLRAGCYWPGLISPGIAELRQQWRGPRAVCAIVFYRALLQSGSAEPVDALIDALTRCGINPMPLYVASLKDPLSAATLSALFSAQRPQAVLNLTSFAVGSPGMSSLDWQPTPLDRTGGPVLQAILASLDEDSWRGSEYGLPARDIAMHLALPEVDGRIASRAVAFKSQSRHDEATQCPITCHYPQIDRVRFVGDLTARWIRLGQKPPAARRVALLLANYPNKDGRLANGVGLDTPASAGVIIKAMQESGYDTGDAPADSAELMRLLLSGPTNRIGETAQREGSCRLRLADYRRHYAALPESTRAKVAARWGAAQLDPAFAEDGFVLAAHRFGNLVIAIQPARGYNIDPESTYHSPDLPPPHGYLAFYFWLRMEFSADAVIHLAKHGNLEWLPGKSTALSSECFPEAALGPLPNICPFIVNDPGEGTQAKRRAQAVIIDHLTPPLTRAESYGPLRELELLIDEYYEAAGVDPRRISHLRDRIFETMSSADIDTDAGIDGGDDADSQLRKLDAYLCELKESQIRDGLHVFGMPPDAARERDLLASLTRIPRGDGKGQNASLLRTLADDLCLAGDFDPLDCDMAAPWHGAKPAELATVCGASWRSGGRHS